MAEQNSQQHRNTGEQLAAASSGGRTDPQVGTLGAGA
jgi:hypothetical protein